MVGITVNKLFIAIAINAKDGLKCIVSKIPKLNLCHSIVFLVVVVVVVVVANMRLQILIKEPIYYMFWKILVSMYKIADISH